MSKTQSPPSASPSPALSHAHCHVAHAANELLTKDIYDTVRLEVFAVLVGDRKKAKLLFSTELDVSLEDSNLRFET